jgi:hypothetical protein
MNLVPVKLSLQYLPALGNTLYMSLTTEHNKLNAVKASPVCKSSKRLV